MNTMRATTLRRNLTIGAALAAALFASQASAATMEEVVARGTNSVAAAQRAHFEAEMASYVRAVDHGTQGFRARKPRTVRSPEAPARSEDRIESGLASYVSNGNC